MNLSNSQIKTIKNPQMYLLSSNGKEKPITSEMIKQTLAKFSKMPQNLKIAKK